MLHCFCHLPLLKFPSGNSGKDNQQMYGQFPPAGDQAGECQNIGNEKYLPACIQTMPGSAGSVLFRVWS